MVPSYTQLLATLVDVEELLMQPARQIGLLKVKITNAFLFFIKLKMLRVK